MGESSDVWEIVAMTLQAACTYSATPVCAPLANRGPAGGLCYVRSWLLIESARSRMTGPGNCANCGEPLPPGQPGDNRYCVKCTARYWRGQPRGSNLHHLRMMPRRTSRVTVPTVGSPCRQVSQPSTATARSAQPRGSGGRPRKNSGLDAAFTLQLAALLTSVPILSSTAAVNVCRAKEVGQMSPSSRFASC